MVLASTIDPLRYASDDRDPTICQRHFPGGASAFAKNYQPSDDR